MKEQKKPISRKDNLVVQELDGEVLIYDLDKNKAFCLNETSSLVWQLCDGNKTISEISESMSRKLNQPANEDLVWLAIDQLKKEKLIINGAELPSKFEGMNRREVIKKVGLGTMIALPIVSGMIAPSAINAASPGAGSPPGTVLGTTSTMGSQFAGDDCGTGATDTATRNTACTTAFGATATTMCSTMMTVGTSTGCTSVNSGFPAFQQTSTFMCVCG